MFRLSIAVAALLTSAAASAQTYAIQAGRLIVDAAQPERGASTVIVENGRITRIYAVRNPRKLARLGQLAALTRT